MRKRFLLSLLVALLTTLSTHAYDIQLGDLYYNITSDNTVEVTYQMRWSGSNYQGLTTATIPATVTYDGTTYSVTSIGREAFSDCSSLTSIILPNSVTSIGTYAFYYCSALTSIILPNSVTSIGDWAFLDCTSLTSIILPNSVKSIGAHAFERCYSLTSITIPNSVTYIGSNAFNYVPNIVYNGTATGSPWGARSVNGYVDGYLVYADETKTISLACSAATTGEVTLPNSVTSIGDYAFYYCTSITSITIGNSVTSIGSDAFEYCSSLTSITIGNSVTSIGGWAFYGCSALTSITCYAPIPPTLLPNAFNNVPRTPLYVPAESVEAYKAADIWKEFDVQALSTDATLSSLTYDGMLVPSFDADTLHYTVDLPSETVAVPVVDAVANDSDAQVLITQAAALPGEASVEVLAADKTTRQTYTIYFSKKSTPTDISNSPDATETASDKGATKLLRDGQVVILRNGETYDMMGQRM